MRAQSQEPAAGLKGIKLRNAESREVFGVNIIERTRPSGRAKCRANTRRNTKALNRFNFGGQQGIKAGAAKTARKRRGGYGVKGGKGQIIPQGICNGKGAIHLAAIPNKRCVFTIAAKGKIN